MGAHQGVILRPIEARDAAVLQSYVRSLSAESRYNRFFGALQELSPAELDRVTHLDQTHHIGLLVESSSDGTPLMIGEARYAPSADGGEGECALSVAEAWRRQGIGTLLLGEIECRARRLGVRLLGADILRSNEAMKALARKAGFSMAGVPRDARLVHIVKDLMRSRATEERACVTASDPAIAASRLADISAQPPAWGIGAADAGTPQRFRLNNP